MIKLSANLEKPVNNKVVFYNFNDRGLDTFPQTQSDITLLVSYVQIGFDSDDMCANQIFGFSPLESWINRKIFAPDNVTSSALRLDEDFDYGTWRIDRGNEWKCYFDLSSNWLCVGNPDTSSGLLNINFMNNAIVTLDTLGELKALWIRLNFEGKE